MHYVNFRRSTWIATEAKNFHILWQIYRRSITKLATTSLIFRSTSDVFSSLESLLFYSLIVGIKDSALLFQEIVSSIRSSCSQMFFKIGALKSFPIFIGRKLRWSLFSKSCRPKSCNFTKNSL